jgi:hypothetical protein
MTIAELKTLVSYITDADGKQTSVLVPAEVWKEILQALDQLDSDLDPEIESSNQRPSILERMGEVPQYSLSNPDLSDRTQRKAAIYQHIQARHNARS